MKETTLSKIIFSPSKSNMPSVKLDYEVSKKKFGENIFEMAVINFVEENYKSMVVCLIEIAEKEDTTRLSKVITELKSTSSFMCLTDFEGEIRKFESFSQKKVKDWVGIKKSINQILAYLASIYEECLEYYKDFIKKQEAVEIFGEKEKEKEKEKNCGSGGYGHGNNFTEESMNENSDASSFRENYTSSLNSDRGFANISSPGSKFIINNLGQKVSSPVKYTEADRKEKEKAASNQNQKLLKPIEGDGESSKSVNQDKEDDSELYINSIRCKSIFPLFSYFFLL